MRVRLPFAGVFAFVLIVAAYAGLTPNDLESSPYPLNDKVLHVLVLFILTTSFYWIIDASRRRVLHLTLSVCTGALALGSELVQAVLPNGRDFDLLDVVANVVGSLAAVTLSSWYHVRMLERRRQRRVYAASSAGLAAEDDEGVELVEGSGAHESGVINDGDLEAGFGPGVQGASSATPNTRKATTLEEEVDNWDENELDAWEEDDEDMDTGGRGEESDSDEERPSNLKRTD